MKKLLIAVAVLGLTAPLFAQAPEAKTETAPIAEAAPAKADASGGSGLGLQIDKILGLQLQQLVPRNKHRLLLRFLGRFMRVFHEQRRELR